MGNAPSSILFQDWTSDELASAVSGLGAKFQDYAPRIVDNGVNGRLLHDFSTAEFAETLMDLEITNRLHCRVLTKEWNQQKERIIVSSSSSSSSSSQQQQKQQPLTQRLPPPPEQQQQQQTEEGQVQTITTKTTTNGHDRPNSSSSTTTTSAQTTTTTIAPSSNPLRSAQMVKQLSVRSSSFVAAPFDPRTSSVAIESLELSPFMEPEELQGFEDIADKLYYHATSPVASTTTKDTTSNTSNEKDNDNNDEEDEGQPESGSGGGSVYAGVHLWDPDGHVVISSVYQTKDGELVAMGRGEWAKENWIHMDKSLSICHEAIMMDDDTNNTPENDYVSRRLEPGTYPLLNQGGQYYGYVFRDPDNGVKLGMVCTLSKVVEEEEDEDEEGAARCSCHDNVVSGDSTDTMTMRDRLKELAAETEYYVQLRKTRLARKRDHTNDDSATVLPSHGPIPSVTQYQVDKRPSYFPYPEELKRTGRRRSSMHIPEVAKLLHYKKKTEWGDDKDGNTVHDNHNIGNDIFFFSEYKEGTPIAPDEMARVAMTESLGIQDITPDHPTGIAIKNLIQMAGIHFQVEHAEFTTLDLGHHRGLARYVRSDDYETTLEKVFQFGPTSLDEDGQPWACSMKRNGEAICNYTIALGRTFVVHDLLEDDTFAHLGKMGFQFYAGAPVLIRGQTIGCVCLTDSQPRPDFTKAHEIQLEHVAELVAHQIDNWVLRNEMEQLEKEREMLLLTQQQQYGNGSRGNSYNMNGTSNKSSMPEHHAALVFTDIQGSTALWEANPEAMSEALALHDSIVRKHLAENSGYEFKTEGDAFHIAFHDAVDAVKFALSTQEALHTASWSEGLLALPDACENVQGCFRGLRVRMGIHYGEVTSRDNQTSGTREYCGPTYHVARSLERMSHAGQILVTDDVWKITSYVADTCLQSPQVLDLGVHVLMNGSNPTDGIIAKNVLQLVPATLAFDYVANRTRGNQVEGTTTSSIKGREFPPVLSKKQLTSCFHDAPYQNNRATIMFIDTADVEKQDKDHGVVLSALAKLIGAILREHESGYQCRNFKLCFHTPSDAITVGLKLQEALNEGLVLGEDLSELVKVGVLEGEFMSMGPHPRSGRAEYNGRMVNRAARVANAAAPGSVYLGAMTLDETPTLEMGLVADFLCMQAMKGVQEEMALFECRRE
jgi:class 3 adenylate cyclase